MASPKPVQKPADDYLTFHRTLSRSAVEKIYFDAYQQKQRESIRWLARWDRYFLLTCILHRQDVRNDWLFQRCREVETDPDERIDVWGRWHFKSSIITFAGIIQEILRDPEITICIFSHDKPTAKKFLSQIKEELEKNEELKSLFPEIFWKDPHKEAPWWSEDGGIVVRRKGTHKEATVEASGLLGGMSTGKHFALRVYDDIVTEETVTSTEMIKKITERYELSEFLGEGQGRNRQWIIGTRYHYGDTYGILLKRGFLTARKHPATHDGTFDGKPVFMSEQKWADMKGKLSRPVIAAQMLQNPLAGSETKFDVKWLIGTGWEIRPKRVNVYIMMDPSKGRNENSDYTAMVVIGVDATRNKYLLDGACHRMKLSARWNLLRDTYRKWINTPGVEMVFVGYEQFGMQTDNEYFEERMQIEEISFAIQELMWPHEGRRSKEWRIERLEPDYRHGRLKLPGCYQVQDDGSVKMLDVSKTKLGQQAVFAREKYRIPEPIRRVDENRRVYDFVGMLLEEYSFYPFAPRDDILDAESRIYDMDPVPPVHIDMGNRTAYGLEPPGHIDS